MQEQVKTTDEAVSDLKKFISAEYKKSNDQNVSAIQKDVLENLNQYWESINDAYKKAQNELFTPSNKSIAQLKQEYLVLHQQVKKSNRIQYALHIANLIILATLIFYFSHSPTPLQPISTPQHSTISSKNDTDQSKDQSSDEDSGENNANSRSQQKKKAKK